MNDCEKVSDGINTLLDEADYIKEQYFLEVSSPGIERVLRKNGHLQSAIQKEVEINLFKPINGKKVFVGILKQFNEEKVVISETESNEEIEIERKNISLIKEKYNW